MTSATVSPFRTLCAVSAPVVPILSSNRAEAPANWPSHVRLTPSCERSTE